MPRPQGLPKTGGRQKGTPNKRTQQILDQAAAEGITPLEVQLRTMRMLWERAHQTRVPDLELAKQACAVAVQCAPYMHPRLAAVEAKVAVDARVEEISFEEQKRQALAAFDAAFGVVRTPEGKLINAEEFKVPDQRMSPVIEHQPSASDSAGTPAVDNSVAEGHDPQPQPPPREFAREGSLEVAPDVPRLPTRRYSRPPRVIGLWSG